MKWGQVMQWSARSDVCYLPPLVLVFSPQERHRAPENLPIDPRLGLGSAQCGIFQMPLLRLPSCLAGSFSSLLCGEGHLPSHK